MKIFRAVMLMMTVGLVAACDDNPVADDRETTFRLYLSPTHVNLTTSGAEKQVAGYALNRYGEATYANVTATACDARITIRPDSTLLSIEPPTRVRAKGVTVGTSCIVFAVGGFSDTVTVVVQ